MLLFSKRSAVLFSEKRTKKNFRPLILANRQLPETTSLGGPMISFTIDTNCIVDLDDSRPNAGFIRELSDAHKAGVAAVSIVAIAASERQKKESDDLYIQNFGKFQDRLNKLGISHLDVSLPMAYFDVCFWDHSVFASKEDEELERKIHDVLFPNIPFEHGRATLECNTNSGNAADLAVKWRNAKCDVQTMWNHIHHKRGVFVTADGNFHRPMKKESLLAIGAGRIERPPEAVAILRSNQPDSGFVERS